MPDTHFIGLDLARKATGICVLTSDRIVQLETLSMDYADGEHNGHVFNRLRAIVECLLDVDVPAVVATEAPFLRGFGVSRVQFGMAAAAQMACAERGWQYMECHPSSLKKFATGSGKGKGKEGKQAMMDAARRDMLDGYGNMQANGHPIVTEHEADAYWLARWAMGNAGLDGRRERQV